MPMILRTCRDHVRCLTVLALPLPKESMSVVLAIVFSLGLLLAVLAAPTGAQADSSSRLLLGGGDISISGADKTPKSDVKCVSGHLTDEGIECPALRSIDQVLYTLAGDTGDFEIGDLVCVCGEAVKMSFCMQGRTISVTRISPGEKECPSAGP